MLAVIALLDSNISNLKTELKMKDKKIARLREALECAEYAFQHPDSDQEFAYAAAQSALSEADPNWPEQPDDDELTENQMQLAWAKDKKIAQLREALREIYRRADIQADEPIYELAEGALSETTDDWLWQHDVEVQREVVDYLWRLWWPADSWDAEKRGPLTANALWAELNMARDKEKAEVKQKEQERCITAINRTLDALGQFEDVETDIGSWDVRRYCIAAIRGAEIVEFKQCDAVIFHGPGHQSRTKCRLVGPHDIHEARYGAHDQLARWKDDEVSSGFFDEPPCVEEE